MATNFTRDDESQLVDKEFLHTLLEYKEDGKLIRKTGMNQGKEFGTLLKNKYLRSSVVCKDGQSHAFLAHRLVWIMHHGDIPPCQYVNHKDNDGFNNRIENLELVSNEQNLKLKKQYKNNTSGFPGVYWNKYKNVWQVKFKVDGKLKEFGSFKLEDKEKAIALASKIHKERIESGEYYSNHLDSIYNSLA